MSTASQPEYWLRGPVAGIPSLLQPVAHALLQARDEVIAAVVDFPAKKLWEKPAGLASVGFHLQHLCGVIDRLFTYAKDEQLSEQQLASLETEGHSSDRISVDSLLYLFNEQVNKAILQLQATDPATLEQTRGVGRKKIPTSVAGLLFHAAEHTMRHTGQLLVTIAVLKIQ